MASEHRRLQGAHSPQTFGSVVKQVSVIRKYCTGREGQRVFKMKTIQQWKDNFKSCQDERYTSKKLILRVVTEKKKKRQLFRSFSKM